MKILGIDVGIHWSFWGFVAILVVPELIGLSLPGIAWSLFLAFMIFGLIVGHEFAHALTARRFGYETRSITMHILGGVAMIDMARIKPREEFWVALAGPAFNIALFLLCMLTLSLSPSSWMYIPVEDGHSFTLVGRAVGTFAALNLLIGGFNLVPAYPMDGGRILRSLLAEHNPRFATKVSHVVSSVCGFAFFVGGIYLWSPLLSFLGLIVLFVIWAERRSGARF